MNKPLMQKDIDYVKHFVNASVESHRDPDVMPGLQTHDIDGIVDDVIKMLEFGGFIERGALAGSTMRPHSVELNILKDH